MKFFTFSGVSASLSGINAGLGLIELAEDVVEAMSDTRNGQLGTLQLLQLDKWINQYAKDEMNLDKLSEALLAFLAGELPAKFKSKSG